MHDPRPGERAAARGDRAPPRSLTDALRGRYELLDLLGRGGMGSVYRARELASGREVAIKVLRLAGDPTALARFRREGELTARLRHPGIVTVHARGEGHELAYLVYELVAGARTLASQLPQLDRAQRLAIARQVCAAVGYAHEQGIVHRDLKPENVLLTPDGRALVADFGLAWRQGAERLTATNAFLGTPHYMAPEQFGVVGEIGPPADVWSLGVILFELLTDRLPFEADSLVQLVAAVQQGAPPARSVDPSVPEPLEAICRQALSFEPGERYAHAQALGRDLERALAGQAAGRGALAAALRRGARSPLAWVGGVAVLAVLGVALRSPTGSSDPIVAAPNPTPTQPATDEAEDAWHALHRLANRRERLQAGADWLRTYPEHARAAELRGWLRDEASLAPVALLEQPRVSDVCFLDDRTVIATGADERIRWFDLDGNLLRDLRARGVFRSPCVVAGQVCLTTLTTLEQVTDEGLRRIAAHQVEDPELALTPDGRQLLLAGRSQELVAYDVPTGAVVFKTPIPVPRVSDLAVSADGAWLAASCSDQGDVASTVRVWAWPPTAAPRVLEFDDEIVVVAVSREGRWVAAGARSGRVYLVDRESDFAVRELSGEPPAEGAAEALFGGAASAHAGRVQSLAFCGERPRLLSCAWQSKRRKLLTPVDADNVVVWDPWGERPPSGALHGPLSTWGLAVSPDGRWLVRVVGTPRSDSARVELWSTEILAPR